MYVTTIILLIMGGICAYIAKQKKRSPFLWFFMGVSLHFLALTILLLLPPVEAVAEGSHDQVLAKDTLHSEAIYPDRDSGDDMPRGSMRLPTNPKVDWYYVDPSGNVQGPVKINALRETFHKEKLSLATYVWCEECIDWIKIENFTNHSFITDPDFL